MAFIFSINQVIDIFMLVILGSMDMCLKINVEIFLVFIVSQNTIHFYSMRLIV